MAEGRCSKKETRGQVESHYRDKDDRDDRGGLEKPISSPQAESKEASGRFEVQPPKEHSGWRTLSFFVPRLHAFCSFSRESPWKAVRLAEVIPPER